MINERYTRYGHSLDALDFNNDGIDDYMILAGGYSPEPSNDVWVTTDGTTWVRNIIFPILTFVNLNCFHGMLLGLCWFSSMVTKSMGKKR